jgi:hypothetical protein
MEFDIPIEGADLNSKISNSRSFKTKLMSNDANSVTPLGLRNKSENVISMKKKSNSKAKKVVNVARGGS